MLEVVGDATEVEAGSLSLLEKLFWEDTGVGGGGRHSSGESTAYMCSLPLESWERMLPPGLLSFDLYRVERFELLRQGFLGGAELHRRCVTWGLNRTEG